MTTDPIRAALERAARELELVACAAAQAGFDASAHRAKNEAHAARAVLAAAPPEPVGEVGELVQWLEKHYEYANELGRPDWAQNSHRAAALLRQLSATPQQPAPGEGEGLTDGPAVPEGRKPAVVVGELSDEALLNLWASSPRIDEPHGGIAFARAAIAAELEGQQ